MLEKIKEIIIEQLNLQGVEITEETSFKDDLGADSLDLFELVMAFEEEFGIEMPQDDLENIETVGDVIKLLKDTGINDWYNSNTIIERTEAYRFFFIFEAGPAKVFVLDKRSVFYYN